MRATPPALDPSSLDIRRGSGYPAPFRARLEQRVKRVLGDAVGLTAFGVNLVELPPMTWSSQRHWHTREDEFIYVLEGELTLVTDDGEQVLHAGMSAGFPAGVEDGHHLVNKSAELAVYLEIGERSDDDEVHYPDIDLQRVVTPGGRKFTDKNGKPY